MTGGVVVLTARPVELASHAQEIFNDLVPVDLPQAVFEQHGEGAVEVRHPLERPLLRIDLYLNAGLRTLWDEPILP